MVYDRLKVSVLGGKGLFFNRKGHKVFRKGRKGVLKGINGLLMCGAGKAPGLLNCCCGFWKAVNLVMGGEEVLEDELPAFLLSTCLCEGDAGRKKLGI